MGRTGKAGMAKFVLGEREYLVIIKAKDKMLSLVTLHYSEEIIPSGDLSPKASDAQPEDKGRVESIVREMRADFSPDKYADGRRERITRLLEKKAKEKAPVESPAVEEEDEEGVVDLVAALEESMRKIKKTQ
jgi:DNA end-binding protein Ku